MNAISFAVKKHHGQYRKHKGPNNTQIPYVVHCIETTKKLWDWGIDDEDILTAMVLHDTLEDSPTTKEEIEKNYNKVVANIVDELTFIDNSPKRDDKKAEYIASFRNKSVEALTAKLADRFCNIKDKITSGNKSAVYYFHKADALFDAWVDRRDEVVARFGQAVQDKIQRDYDEIVKLIFG